MLSVSNLAPSPTGNNDKRTNCAGHIKIIFYIILSIPATCSPDAVVNPDVLFAKKKRASDTLATGVIIPRLYFLPTHRLFQERMCPHRSLT